MMRPLCAPSQFFLRLSVVCSIQKVGNSVGRIQGPAMATGGKNESLATSVHNIPKQTLEQARGTAPPPARAPPGVGATPQSSHPSNGAAKRSRPQI